MYVPQLKHYLELAREYNRSHQKNYPLVYFSGDKSGRWGVTFPAPNEQIGHTSTDMVGHQNNRDFATAVAMFVLDISKENASAYLEWAQKNNLFKRKVSREKTNALYVRYEYYYGDKYKVCIPKETFGYEVVPQNEISVHFSTIKSAISARNRELEWKLNNEELSINRENAFKRALSIGAFQEFHLRDEDCISDKKINIDNFSTTLAMFSTYTICDNLKYDAIIVFDWLETLGNETSNIKEVLTSLENIREYLKNDTLSKDSLTYITYLITICNKIIASSKRVA